MSRPRTRPVHLKHPLPPGAGPFAQDLDPEDSERLRRLRSLIDSELGWASQDDEESGDYEARLIEVAAELRALRPLESVVDVLRAGLNALLCKVEDLMSGAAPVDFDEAAREAREREERRG